MWGETKHPKPEDQLPPDQLKFVDPADSFRESGTPIRRLEIAVLALGIASLVMCCVPAASILLGVIAVVLGIREILAADYGGAKFAKVGLVLGIVGIFIGILSLLFPQLFEIFGGVANDFVPSVSGIDD
jgi:uncharacterized membrane protein HdeD (DUF308 family)